jgi:hypothetical protein
VDGVVKRVQFIPSGLAGPREAVTCLCASVFRVTAFKWVCALAAPGVYQNSLLQAAWRLPDKATQLTFTVLGRPRAEKIQYPAREQCFLLACLLSCFNITHCQSDPMKEFGWLATLT